MSKLEGAPPLRLSKETDAEQVPTKFVDEMAGSNPSVPLVSLHELHLLGSFSFVHPLRQELWQLDTTVSEGEAFEDSPEVFTPKTRLCPADPFVENEHEALDVITTSMCDPAGTHGSMVHD
jgi:hypothetical protein